MAGGSGACHHWDKKHLLFATLATAVTVAFRFVKLERGNQLLKLIEIDAAGIGR